MSIDVLCETCCDEQIAPIGSREINSAPELVYHAVAQLKCGKAEPIHCNLVAIL